MAMTYDEYKDANLHVVLVANAIEALPLDKIREEQEYAVAIGPIVDPTLYRKKVVALQIDSERTRILQTAQRELKALRARAEARQR